MTKPVEQFIDLSTLDTIKACDKPYRYELKNPETGEPLGQFIHIYGRDATVFTEWGDEKYDREVREAAQAAKRGQDIPPKSRAQIRREAIEYIAIGIAEFENLHYKGAVVTYSFKVACDILTELLWIKVQLDREMIKIENFMKA